jgi:hypothetical protein
MGHAPSLQQYESMGLGVAVEGSFLSLPRTISRPHNPVRNSSPFSVLNLFQLFVLPLVVQLRNFGL